MHDNDALPAMVERKSLSLASIRTDGGTQARDGLTDDAVEEYAAAIKDGKKLPALKVVWDGACYWLWDGFHTWQAAQSAGKRSWSCEIWHGNLSLARVLAASANQEHGVRRDNATKRRAVKMVLAERPAWSSRAIAEHCGVSHTFVEKVRSDCRETPVRTPSPEPPQVATVATSSATRVGRDGKPYPAFPARKDAPTVPFELPRTDPPAADSPAANDPEPATGDPEPEPPAPTPTPALPMPREPEAPVRPARPAAIVDAAGLLVREERLMAWHARDRFAAIISILRQAQRFISDLAQSDGGQLLRAFCELKQTEGGRQTLTLDQITAVIRKLEVSQPHAMTCPYCHVLREGRIARDCSACKGRGWVNKLVWEAAPEEHREACGGKAA